MDISFHCLKGNTTLPIIVGVPVLTFTLLPVTATNTLTPPGSANGDAQMMLPPK